MSVRHIEGTIFSGDFTTLRSNADPDQLGVPLSFLTRHAIRLAIDGGSLATGVATGMATMEAAGSGIVRALQDCTVFSDDLATLQAHAATLGVPVSMVVRHAIRLGRADLNTDIETDGDDMATLEALE